MLAMRNKKRAENFLSPFLVLSMFACLWNPACFFAALCARIMSIRAVLSNSLERCCRKPFSASTRCHVKKASFGLNLGSCFLPNTF